MGINDETALQIFRQRAHDSLIEGMLWRLFALVAPLVAPKLEPQEAKRAMFRAIMQGLEADAAFADKLYLSDPVLSEASDAMRALYADEFREVAERLKSSVNRFLAELEEKHAAP